jgi:hypothetical protein
MPPMPPPGMAGGSFFFGVSATMASVVIMRPATDAASCRATRTTFAGSTMPAFSMSTYCSVWASKPKVIGLDRRRKLPVDRSDGLIQHVDLADKRTKCAAHAIGNHDLAILVETVGSHALQVIGLVRALRCDEADLGQTAAQSIERRRALAGEQLARSMAHQFGLVVDRTHRHEPLARTTHRLADRRCVNLVTLLRRT